MLTERIVSELVRQRMGIADASRSAMIISHIPEALKATGRKVAFDPELRPLMISDQSTAQGSLTLGGRLDLATLYTTYRVIKETLSLGEIYLLPRYDFLPTAVDFSADTISLAAGQRVSVGDRVWFATTSVAISSVPGGAAIATGLPSGLSAATDYYVKTWSPTTRKLTLSSDLGFSTTVDLADTGTGMHTLIVQETADKPMRPTNVRSQSYGQYLGGDFRYFYVQGDTLHILPNTTRGNVALAVPTFPATLAQLPEDTQIERVFIESLVSLVAPAIAAQSNG